MKALKLFLALVAIACTPTAIKPITTPENLAKFKSDKPKTKDLTPPDAMCEPLPLTPK